MTQKKSVDFLHIIRILIVLLFFLFFFISFLKIDLHSYDFWWLLKGYWLAQVIFYKVYGTWDVKGIIILRSLLMILFLFFIYLTIRKQGVSPLLALVLTTGCFFIQKSFSGERPVLFTFLAFSVVFYLLEDYRINRSKKVFLIPFLVLLLANMHPGYVVCIMMITLYIIGEGLRYFFSKNASKDILKGLLIIWGLTVMLSILNPNGAVMLKRIFYDVHGGAHIKGIIEFTPTFTMFKNKIFQIRYSYIAFLALSLLGLRYLKRIGITHLIILATFTVMGFVALRYVIFFMGTAAPILARIIICIKEERVFQKIPPLLKPREVFLHVIAFLVGFSIVLNTIPSFARDSLREETKHYVPKGAADFLSSIEIQGNMFNEFGFGGYFIWRLYPDKKVFIDGRALEPEVYKEYQKLVQLEKWENGSWKDIIEKYDISYIVLPPIYQHGGIIALVEELFINDNWVLLYVDHLALIFLKNDIENASLMEQYEIDKSIGLHTIIVQASSRAMRNKVNPYFLISLGKVFFMMGRLDDAEKAFLMASEKDPDNNLLKFWMHKLENTRKKL
jgi:hypothetical protein